MSTCLEHSLVFSIFRSLRVVFGVSMDQFAAEQQTNPAKLQRFLQLFQTKERTIRVNQAKVTSENAFHGYHFGIEGNYECSKNVKTLFWVFQQIFDTCFNHLIEKFYIYVSQAFFGFSNFQGISCCFQKLKVKLFHSTLHFEQKETELLASQIQQTYQHLIKDFKPKKML